MVDYSKRDQKKAEIGTGDNGSYRHATRVIEADKAEVEAFAQSRFLKEEDNMTTLLKRSGILFYLALAAAALILASCGGGGGSEGISSGSASGTGNVALLLTDGPADYDNIWISVTKVSLIPADRNPNQAPVVIFESANGHEVELLELRDQDFLLTVKKRVPAGWYSKIRLEVNDIQAEGGPCADLELKLPSGKIDLNPQGEFEVRTGQTLSIRLDIDANKSINFHEAGNSGKCIFRPVVFVDIDTITTPQRCPRLLAGEIKSIVTNEGTGVVEGFVLDLNSDDLNSDRGEIDVWLSNNPRQPTIVFGEDGNRVRPNALEPGQKVGVRGMITSDGGINASVVIIGGLLNINGIVVSPVDADSKFPLKLDPGQQIVGDQVNVEVTAATLVLLGCDEEVDTDAIQRGRRARVVGKFDVDENVLRAVAVFLEDEQISGDLLRIERATGGTNLVVGQQDGGELTVFLPQETPIFLRGDGEIPLGLLNRLLLNCGPKKVVISLDPAEAEPTAIEVRVEQDSLYGRVAALARDRVIVLEGDITVRIQEGATILLNTDSADIPVDIGAIRIGDELTLYGLEACSAIEEDFYAYIVLINDSSTN